MSMIDSIDPTTGAIVESVAEVTTNAEVDALASKAAAAAPVFAALGREFRARLLRAIADELESIRTDIVAVGTRETALPEARLNGELTRTVYQARLFAEVVDDGGYLEATIDHAGDTPMGPGPDLRRLLVPLGPVAVFGASNFPLAFSVPGGDTVSALAAGCPVIVKAHSSHPALSKLTFDTMTRAARTVDAPDGLLGIVFGTSSGARLVANPAIAAVGFTGSLGGGKALLDIIAGRPGPIPFYGELSSLNPLVVTPGAAAARGADIAAGVVASVTGSGGQLCTKPGLVLVPLGSEGDALVSAAAELVEQAPAATLLNQRISTSYDQISTSLKQTEEVTVIAEGGKPVGDGFSVTPRLLQVDATSLHGGEVEECFGPTAIIARYDLDSLDQAIAALPASLTSTIHAEDDETELVQRLSASLLPKSGRLLFNGYPTGVLVSWAQQHGGPWPSTNTLHTSVGTTSIRRWLRPVTWQSAPTAVLPEELQDDYLSIPRRVDGRLQLGQ
ncbi:aldehyde dehydrogenase (NADP(+)) [Rhodococcus sp. B10]|uniref:aldehyde dehydrogenase (NADP(+)) n=1 Tax=Rhodococcus sp. B10 TaxID=2695876 RepID=UPI00143040A7|nr:aldehyde dehydrogenase (NADP(+)) [Rhodococcus sp. B10]NIL77291.1 NADP-dependent fatty aldehyde dehydrogenase [Rhodococcus sp. B10]